MDRFDPVRTASDIKRTYRRYLASLIASRDPRIGAALTSAIENSPMLDKGPFLEATPPYATGASIRDLIAEGVLCGGFEALASDALPLDRPLYRHQEESIRKVRSGRNVVVATGTGSGKTESFLLPIIDSLLREREAGSLGHGVRALLLYPMNALANDQLKRLRALLKGYPRITFGRYTGDTEHEPERARDLFSTLNPGEPILPNELLSRQEMRETPPHVLLTNYAMLEYLLLRPQDMGLFPADGPHTWRFVAVDEAHVYDGTQGAEIAMLLRRLRDRVDPDGRLQCIATSATVGSDPQAVVEFATRLFDSPFEWVDADRSRRDLITAQRRDAPTGPFWGPLSASDYQRLAAADEPAPAVLAAAASAGVTGHDAAVTIAHEQRLAELRTLLAASPMTFDIAARRVFGDDPDASAGLSSLVAVASGLSTPDGSPALSARYHLFLRATEGAFTCLSDSGPHVQLARHDECPECQSVMFELGACRRCGQVHLLGSIETRQGRLTVSQRAAQRPTTWLVLGDDPAQQDEDESVVGEAGKAVEADRARLCARCGVLSSENALTCDNPDCAASELRPVSRLRSQSVEPGGCLTCGARGPGIVAAFETGADAAGAVLATSLYQNLPGDESGSAAIKPGAGRKLLMFSDSRQAAAFFAPYLSDTYRRIQRRRLVYQGLERAGAGSAPVSTQDVVAHARTMADQARLFHRRDSSQDQERAVAPWVMAEAVAVDDRQSLEGVGLLRLTLDRDPAWTAPGPLLSLGLSDEEAWDLLGELVRSLRQQGALTMPDDVPANHEIFSPRLGPIYVRGEGPEPTRKVLSWLPGRGTNRRVDYVTKVLRALGSHAHPDDLLRGMWRFLTSQSVDWLARSTPRGLGEVRQVDHELLRFAIVSDASPAFRCTTCSRVVPVSVRGICPAMGCSGRLERFVPPTSGDLDHYRSLYTAMTPVPLTAIEHTAQWLNTEAAKIQQEFIRGDVNALSCSTTFELGVDVGELQAVMLRNVPPSTANYVQRAGRAGRRASAAALVVTYAQRRSHDLTHFADPMALMSGTVRAPYVPLENPRIAVRHVYSVAMSAFFRWDLATNHRMSRTAGDFFLGSDAQEAPVHSVRTFLTPVSPEVKASVSRILPASVRSAAGVEDDSWVTGILDLLETVRLEIAGDVESLSELEESASAGRNYTLAQRFKGVVNTLMSRDLLGFLANHNVIPKYGFPVDTVALRTEFGTGASEGKKLELSRDLSQAIHEYAPNATVVAGGHLWESAGVYRLPGRELVEFKYRVCEHCGKFTQSLTDLTDACSVCGRLPTTAQRTFIVPEFGFVADPEPKRPGSRPPQSAWSGATHVVSLSEDSTESMLTLPGGSIEVSVGPRGRLVALSDGPGGRGYRVCDWCGWAQSMQKGKAPRTHRHLIRTGRDCNGPLRWLDLAHSFETDLLSLDIRLDRDVANLAAWKSVLYAVLEAASTRLQIARDDIGGTLRPTGLSSWSLVLYDTVPGGGGNVLRIADRLEDVMGAALQRVQHCECGSETSCYGCLRGYRNQRDHDVLSRGAAAEMLQSLGVTSRL